MAELSPHICFEVLGKPVTQGSTRVIPIKAKGGGYRMRPDGRPMLVPKHDKAEELHAWRQDVAVAARRAYQGQVFIGPIRLSLVFYRPRPKGHFGTGRNAGKLKDSAAEYPVQRPDLLKLARAVEDACTTILWADDSQIVEETLGKRWGSFRLLVEVQSLDGRTQEG